MKLWYQSMTRAGASFARARTVFSCGTTVSAGGFFPLRGMPWKHSTASGKRASIHRCSIFVSLAQTLREDLNTLVQPRMRDEIKMLENLGVCYFAVGTEIVCDRSGESGPVIDRYGTRGPSVIARMNPAIPERERDVKLAELWRRSARKPMLEPVEAPANGVELIGLMCIGVKTQVRHERIPRLHVIHHPLTLTLRGITS